MSVNKKSRNFFRDFSSLFLLFWRFIVWLLRLLWLAILRLLWVLRLTVLWLLRVLRLTVLRLLRVLRLAILRLLRVLRLTVLRLLGILRLAVLGLLRILLLAVLRHGGRASQLTSLPDSYNPKHSANKGGDKAKHYHYAYKSGKTNAEAAGKKYQPQECRHAPCRGKRPKRYFEAKGENRVAPAINHVHFCPAIGELQLPVNKHSGKKYKNERQELRAAQGILNVVDVCRCAERKSKNPHQKYRSGHHETYNRHFVKYLFQIG